MGLFSNKKKQEQKQTNDIPNTNIDNNANIPVEYQGPNVLGSFEHPSAFIYGQPVQIKVNDEDHTVVQAGMFIKDSNVLEKLPDLPQSVLEGGTDAGLPVRLTIKTINAETAQALVNQLTAMPNLMLATVGTVKTRINQRGVAQIEFVIPFGAFVMISADTNGQPLVTTTNISVSGSEDKTSSHSQPYHVRQSAQNRQQSTPLNDKQEDNENEQPKFNINSGINSVSDEDFTTSNQTTFDQSGNDDFNSKLNDL